MNKAFTKEDEGGPGAALPDEPWPLPPGTTNYMTPAGARALRAELAARMSALAGAPPEARPELQRRIRALERRFREGQIVAPPPEPPARVAFGTRVATRDAAGVERAYALVGVDEAAPAAGKVSWQSAIARALMGRAVGDVVTVRAPGGERELEILGIERLEEP